MGQPSQPDLTGALDRLWIQFLPLIEERVSILEAAAAARADESLAPALREEARSAAHKLAGVLGTFGLAGGTTLAREAEEICSSDPQDDPVTAERLSAIAFRLRTMLDSRKS